MGGPVTVTTPAGPLGTDVDTAPVLGPGLPAVDPDRVAYWLECGTDATRDHPDECICTWCLAADTDRHLAGQGLDPSRHWAEIPGRHGMRRVPWWSAPNNARRRSRRSGPRARPAPAATVVFPPVPDLDRVPVAVGCLGAGMWVRLAGVDKYSDPVELSGAIMGGPDPVELDDVRMFAVLIDGYRGAPARVVYVTGDTDAYLIDDPDEHAARGAHACAPVFGPPVMVEYLELITSKRAQGTQRWVPRVAMHPTPALLAELNDSSRYRIRSVERGPRPIPEGVQ